MAMQKEGGKIETPHHKNNKQTIFKKKKKSKLKSDSKTWIGITGQRLQGTSQCDKIKRIKSKKQPDFHTVDNLRSKVNPNILYA